MRVTSRKVLSPLLRTLVEDECSSREVEYAITDLGAWIFVKMTGEMDAITAAWAAIRAGRNDGS